MRGPTVTGALQVVVMGVSGTGKSAVGSRVAERLGVPYVEGDEHHPAANIAKMAAGTPLTDDDRRPWLEELAELLASRQHAGTSALLGCSALRRTYRDLLRGGLPAGTVGFLHLVAEPDVLHRRMEEREHFMPPSLLRSQLATLEPLEPDELGTAIDVDAPLDMVVERGVEAVRALAGRGAELR
ncbi:gluconokinase [Aeromicrobium sp.]|uniref:gluconokinase n=2 Tax=Aeromicrobium sp. TaxID=1871063 RepID=UPI00351170EA